MPEVLRGAIERYYHGEALVHQIADWRVESKQGVHFTTICNFVGFHTPGQGQWASTKREQFPTCLWCVSGMENHGYQYRELP